MHNNRGSIEIIKKLLVGNGIGTVVISPGGTNIPFVRAVQDDPSFTCYSVVDERSAAYFAIGLYLQTGRPVVLCCTSAQATRNYVPGLTEAFYKRVPLLAITMQKHPRFTYQEYMQAPDQSSLPRDCVKGSYTMPYISDVNDRYHGIRVANEAIQELSRDGEGPVQLCVPWLDFPLEDIEPDVRLIRRYGIEDDWDAPLQGKRVLVVIGEHRPFSDELKGLIDGFCERYGAVVYANLLSNFHSRSCTATNLAMASLRKDEFARLLPDVCITIGGQTGDYPLFRMLSSQEFSSMEVWRVGRDGAVVDTYDKLTRVFQCTEEAFFRRLCQAVPEEGCHMPGEYLEAWEGVRAGRSTDLAVPYSCVSIAKGLSRRIPAGSVVQLSILNSLRVWDLFEFDEGVEFYSNVGAFGIDGGMSTLVGQSFATDKMCFMVIGDLAFLYDMNCLSVRGVRPNLRILLINNNGGFEFKLDTGPSTSTDRFIAAAGHFKTARGWAGDCGFSYISARTETEFERACGVFLSDSDRPIILEAFVSDADEYEAYHALLDANRNQTVSEAIKGGVKKSLRRAVGQDKIDRIASIFERGGK